MVRKHRRRCGDVGVRVAVGCFVLKAASKRRPVKAILYRADFNNRGVYGKVMQAGILHLPRREILRILRHVDVS